LLVTNGSWAGEWEVRERIPFHVYGHGGAVLDGKLHCLGGCHTKDWQAPGKYHQVYDPAADAWTAAAELPLAVGWPMPAVHGGRIYLFGGGYFVPGPGITSTTKAWVFDPAANRWSAIRDLPVPIMNGFAVTVGNVIYVGLGYNRQGGLGTNIVAHYRNTYRYDPARDTYERVADAPELGCYASAGQWEGKAYVVAGANIEVGFHDMKDYQWADGALKYDPAANRWTKINTPRLKKRVFYLTQCTSSAVAGPRLFAVGGMGEYRDRTIVGEYFDMQREVFREIPSLLEPRCCGGGGVTGDLLILAGGFFGVAEDLGDVCEPTWVLDVSDLPEVVDGNLARNRPAQASSEREGHQAVRANDGSLDTYWEPAGEGATNTWWKLDLAGPRRLAECKLTWDSSAAMPPYVLEVSVNGTNWVAAKPEAFRRVSARVEVVNLAGANGRYLRLQFSDSQSAWHPRLREIEVQGTEP